MASNRRTFLGQAAGLATLAALPASTAQQPRTGSERPTGMTTGLPADWRRRRKFDAHNHVFLGGRRSKDDWTDVDNLVEAAEILGIERVFCSRPIVNGVMADINVVRDANDSVLAAIGRHPQRLSGYCFVQPGNGQAALDEIDRCLAAGMIGVKLYNQFKFTDPVVFPIAERCIARGIPFLGHSAFLTDPRSLAQQPRTSHAQDFCALSQRYPELLLILGHINGGGDWEWTIKALRECPNVFVDTSGSVTEDDAIGQCVRELGAHRVVFATDATMEGCVGKIFSAELSAEQQEDVFWRNFQRILDRRKA
jgi:uncharacterized protein